VNELQGRCSLLGEEGGCAIKKMLRSLLMKAQTGWSVWITLRRHIYHNDHPVCALRRLRAFFLLAQPPLLFQEGNTCPGIHTLIERRYSRAAAVIKLVLKRSGLIIAGMISPPNRREHNI